MQTVSIALFAGAIGCALTALFPIAGAGQTTENVLYSFCSKPNCLDGAYPEAGLVNVKGTLYGTTLNGGTNSNSGCYYHSGCGTVFSLDPATGTEKVLYSFCEQQYCNDGYVPDAGLIYANGRLYGTTPSGGTYNRGAVFSLALKTGKEKLLYSFCSQSECTDGVNPKAGVIDVNGTLYGTTYYGGNVDWYAGTLFALDLNTGTERLAYSFCSQESCTDGANSNAGLIDINGTLYGTTTAGGASFHGTVFSLDPNSGTEKVVYSFCSQENCTDGNDPWAGLIDVNGTLYGTTGLGGAYDYGGVFSLDPNTGTEKLIYSFCTRSNCKDGEYPESSLINVNGILYGTTYYGGGNTTDCTQGCGAVFSVDPNTGTETVVYSFCSQENCTDGESPNSSLIDVKGALYGTTRGGGAHGGGTAFSITR